MTIEKLANMVAEGFANTAKKSDLADTERRLTAKIEAIDKKVDTLEEVDVRDLQWRGFVLEKDVKQIKHKHV